MKADTYLAHHGIKGQKWGVRRYRNPDGSLKRPGKLRYEEGKKFRASNGIEVGDPQTRWQKIARKLPGATSSTTSRAGNIFSTEAGRRQATKEARALREYNAHQKDLKRGTGTKYLEKALRKNNIEVAYEEINDKYTRGIDRMMFDDSTRRSAARIYADNAKLTYDEAIAKSKKQAIASRAIRTSAKLAYSAAKEYNRQNPRTIYDEDGRAYRKVAKDVYEEKR